MNLSKPHFKRKKTEESLQISLSRFIKLQYPNIYFNSESSGLKVPIGLAVKMKKQRSNHTQLDFNIFEPNNNFHGLILELKKDWDEVFKKNGELRETEHIQEQYKSIKLLRAKGYYADFGCGLEDCISIIKSYLKNKEIGFKIN